MTLTVEQPTGPGTIRGQVQVASPAGPAAGLRVSTAGAEPVTTSDDGAFVLPGVGPGPVEVTVAGEGFEPVTEAVQVPAEADVELRLTVHTKSAVKRPGTLRGLVRSATAKALKAMVTVVETKAQLDVGADGRFTVTVPAGRYTLVVEAKGHVTQTFNVDIAAGDHAIFHCNLEPSRR